MDLRGMPDDFAPVVDFNDRMYGIYTAAPGRILAFDGTLATVQITVQCKTIQNGKIVYLDPPPVTNVPVVLPSSTGAGVFITVPVQINDPCLLIFGQRGIDNVVQGDGRSTVPPPDVAGNIGTSTVPNALLSRIRHHDMADAICIPGLLCQQGAPANWNMSGVELRNAAGSVSVRVTASTIQSQGPWTHTGPLMVQGLVTSLQTGNTL